MQPRSCGFVDFGWCEPQILAFGGPPEAWRPDRVPKLYSLANCCAQVAVNPILVPVPPAGYRVPRCVPELDDHFTWWTDVNVTPRAQAQGLEMCYSEEALNSLPAMHIWTSPAVWNHSQYVAMAAMSESIKRAGVEDSIYLEVRK